MTVKPAKHIKCLRIKIYSSLSTTQCELVSINVQLLRCCFTVEKGVMVLLDGKRQMDGLMSVFVVIFAYSIS